MSGGAIPLNGHKPAVLALADGSLFYGHSIGIAGQTVGEVVFNTAMTGYQEILTDPSYAEQIVTLTYPHVGNVGVNPDDCEANNVYAAGLIIREMSPCVSNWRATQSLTEYLEAQGIVAIAGVDTRRLTRLLRTSGAQNGCILTDDIDSKKALSLAKNFAGLQGKDLAKVVSTREIKTWSQGTFKFLKEKKTIPSNQYHVIVYDYGVKYQILRMLVDRGCQVTVVPAQTSVEEVIAMKPDGILLSNGPGDPAACDYAIRAIQIFLEKEIPLFGICLGFQLLALACGGKTVKMKFGHHGANHPVQELASDAVYITSQNHSFAVEEESLPEQLYVTHRSLFDTTLQGIAHRSKPAFAFQGHPEASPGPHDIGKLFDHFMLLIEKRVSYSSCLKELT